jgi:hypothetical protein
MKLQHAFVMAALTVGLLSCRGTTSREAPIVGIRNMYDQPRYNMQSESEFFDDKRTMRPLVEGVVAREQLLDERNARGRLEDDSGYVLTIPKEAIDHHGGMEKMLNRGRERFDIYCSPCHDKSGSGDGMVKKRAIAAGATAFQPPSFHQARLRQIPDGQLFATISNGKGNMPPYAFQLPPADRWAIVAYVRALQLSQDKPETKP